MLLTQLKQLLIYIPPDMYPLKTYKTRFFQEEIKRILAWYVLVEYSQKTHILIYVVFVQEKNFWATRAKPVLGLSQNCGLSPTNNYLFKINNRNTSERWEIRSKLTIKSPEPGQWRQFGVFIVYFKDVLQLFLLLLLLTLNK